MRSSKPHLLPDSWHDQFESEQNPQSKWLDSYRKHLSWIHPHEEEDENDLLKDIIRDL